MIMVRYAGEEMRISVEDQGIGMSEEEQTKLEDLLEENIG